MHCNSRHPDAAQSLSALISSPIPSLNSLSLSVAILELFYYSYVTLRCDLELWLRDLDLWPLTLNIRSRLASPRSNSVRNFSEIGLSVAELLQFEYMMLQKHCRLWRICAQQQASRRYLQRLVFSLAEHHGIAVSTPHLRKGLSVYRPSQPQEFKEIALKRTTK